MPIGRRARALRIVRSGLVRVPGPSGADAPQAPAQQEEQPETHVVQRGWRPGRRVGQVLAALGLAALAAERRANVAGGLPAGLILPAPTWLVPAAAVALGTLVALAFTILPWRKAVEVRLADAQQDDWRQLRGEVRQVRRRARTGVTLLFLGLAVVAASYAVPLDVPSRLGALGAGALVALVGAGTAAIASAQRGPLERLHANTVRMARLQAQQPAPVLAPGLAPPAAVDVPEGAPPTAAVEGFLDIQEDDGFLELEDDEAASPPATR